MKDERYTKSESRASAGCNRKLTASRDDGFHEWFKGYADLQTIFEEIVPDRTSRILMLGTAP